MKTLSRPQPSLPSNGGLPRRGRKRNSPLMLVSIVVTLGIILGAGIFVVVRSRLGSHAANAVNPDCTLIVPADPLSAQGLSTPYQLIPTDPNNGPCNESNPTQSAFVQGAVLDPATGQISVYNPLVIDQGTQPAAAPVVPTLPANAVVALWFGSNGNTLTLQDTNGSLKQGHCVNGTQGSIFGQFSYCNAPAFFRSANAAIQAGQLTPPALGTAKDGQPCPSVRDFGVVDQDQSDNVTTVELITADGKAAQMTAANVAALQNAKPQANGSDNRLVTVALDGILGCTPWTVPDLADPGKTATALPLDELQAAAQQAQPVALVPITDPMVQNNGNPDLAKLNAYRRGVDQPAAANADAASGTTYCQNLLTVAPARIVLDAPMTVNAPAPDPAVGNTLFTFLAARYVASYANLNCQQLTGKPSPLAVTTDGNGVAISATFNGQPISTTANNGNGNGNGNNGNGNGNNGNGNGTGTGNGNGTGTTTTPDCNANGMVVKGCAGTTTINGQNCTFAFANNVVTLNCTAANNGNGNQGNGNGNTGNGNGNQGNGNGNTGNGNGNQGNGNGNQGNGNTGLNFNNTGTSQDANMMQGNFDGWGNSYSAQALKNAGVVPGQTISFNGVTFTWPNSAIGSPDNVMAQGQVIPVTPNAGATTLAFLGSSSNGPSMGNATITYTDGTTQTFLMVFSDWTLGAGNEAPSYGNQIVTTTAYRNTAGGMQAHMPHVFYIDVALQQGKTIQSVTLPSTVDRGQIHVFAIGTK